MRVQVDPARREGSRTWRGTPRARGAATNSNRRAQMKFTKFIVLAGGLLGLLAFFLPLVAVKDSGVTGALSAYRIVKGIDSADQVIEHANSAAVDGYDKSEEFQATKKDANA